MANCDIIRNVYSGTSLAIQWLRLHASTGGGIGSIPGWETKILHAAWHSQKRKKKTEEICIWSLPLVPDTKFMGPLEFPEWQKHLWWPLDSFRMEAGLQEDQARIWSLALAAHLPFQDPWLLRMEAESASPLAGTEPRHWERASTSSTGGLALTIELPVYCHPWEGIAGSW